MADRPVVRALEPAFPLLADRLEASVVVRGDQLHAIQAPLGQELPPVNFGLAQRDALAQNTSVSVGQHVDRDAAGDIAVSRPHVSAPEDTPGRVEFGHKRVVPSDAGTCERPVLLQVRCGGLDPRCCQVERVG